MQGSGREETFVAFAGLVDFFFFFVRVLLDVLFKELELGKLMINFKRARVRCVCVRGGGIACPNELTFFFLNGVITREQRRGLGVTNQDITISCRGR